VPGFLNLGQAMRDKGDLPAAIENYKLALTLEPDSGSARADLGFTLKRSDRLKEALTELSAAVSLAPDLARAHFYYAEALAQSGEASGALMHYERAATLSPRDAGFRLSYGLALVEKSLPAAIAELKGAAGLAPGRADILTALATALRKNGETEESAKVFRQSRDASATASRYSDAVLNTNRAIELLKKGSVDAAIDALKTALAAVPNSADANHYMAIAQSARQNWTEANRAFRAAVEAGPLNPDIHFNYGVALERQHDWAAAVNQFETVVSLRPAHGQGRCMLAEALAHAGEADRSGKTLEQARQLGFCRPLVKRGEEK
jgi:protein O-GlcNAc transferase